MTEEIKISPRTAAGAPAPPSSDGAGASLGDLVRQLADDSRALLRQEIAFAKAELRQNVRSLLRDAVLIGLGGALLAVGLLVLVAFLILGLGRLLGGEYWLSSLIVGAILASLGGLALLSGKRGLQRDELTPQRTVESLRENRDWAAGEVRQIKRDLAT